MHIQPTDRGHVELESQTKTRKTENDLSMEHGSMFWCRGRGHVTFCNMLHCCITFCWLCRRPNVTLPQMNCHVQWFTVIKKRKFVALPWRRLYLDGEKCQKDGNYWPKVRWRHATASATVRVNLESAAVIQIHFDIEATATSPQPPASEYSDCGDADKWNVGWGWS